MPDPVVGRLSVILIDEIPMHDAEAIAALIEKVVGVVEVRYEIKLDSWTHREVRHLPEGSFGPLGQVP